jgi:DNA sulfur modification protein DndC
MAETTKPSGGRQSVFADLGPAKVVQGLAEEIRQLYRCDGVPWVIGYSGGKDSTAVLQLVWLALRDLPPDERQKPVHVISTDTLVEQPLVAAWVDLSLDRMRHAAEEQRMPITPHKLTPEIEDSFWVNLIGKGYPAPRPKFRWCTERLKIRPSNHFIRGVVNRYGNAILVLGTRKAESEVREGRFNVQRAHQLDVADPRGQLLRPNANLPNSLVYTPIEDWTNDDVWLYLMQVRNPWGHDNKTLLTMYRGATEGGECPLVVDTSTPSCGGSRFGCWVCTVVEKDRSMEAMIENDAEKVWMTPLLDLRNELDVPDDRNRRDFRRLTGRVQLFHDRTIPGPYTKEWREHWLRRVLEAQESVRAEGPEEFRKLTLITAAELQEIRRIWVYEKGEFDDSLPRIYREVTGEEFPTRADHDNPLRADDWELLREVCGDDAAFFDLEVRLLARERQYRGMTRRTGIYEALAEDLRSGLYRNEEEAVAVLSERRERKERVIHLEVLPATATEDGPDNPMSRKDACTTGMSETGTEPA